MIASCRKLVLVVIPLAWACAEHSPTESAPKIEGQSQNSEEAGVQTFEHHVPHISSVPANAGARVFLSVVERVRVEGASLASACGAAETEDVLTTIDADCTSRAPRVVLFIHGNTFPGGPGANLGLRRYNWMLALAKAGFDAFTMDHSGYGFSPRPEMDDPCNVDPAQQLSILIPHPLVAPCAATYSFRFATAQSEWDEIDRVVDFLRELRHVERVDLIGWSRGGWRAASYAAQHPEKVGKLVLLAPVYNASESSTPPAVLPQPGFPMTVATREATYASLWRPGIKCAGQVEAGIEDYVWSATVAFDPLGRTWGPPEGVTRVRTFTYWGWNRTAAAAFTSVPTLIVSGEYDTVARTTEALYNDYGTSRKLHVLVQCASHLMPWEIQAANLHRLSAYFLRHGTVQGAATGKFFMDTEGEITPRP